MLSTSWVGRLYEAVSHVPFSAKHICTWSRLYPGIRFSPDYEMGYSTVSMSSVANGRLSLWLLSRLCGKSSNYFLSQFIIKLLHCRQISVLSFYCHFQCSTNSTI